MMRAGRPVALAATLLLVLVGPARGQTTYTWTGRGVPEGPPPTTTPSDAWHNPGNWSPRGVPGPGDRAVLQAYDVPENTPQPGLSARLYGRAVTVAELTLASARQDRRGVTVAGVAAGGAEPLAVTEAFSFSAGTLANLTFTCASACRGGISGGLPKSLSAVALLNRGEVTWNDGRSLGAAGVTITNEGAFVLSAPGPFVDVRGSGFAFVNRGALVKRGGGVTTLGNATFRNEGGTLRADDGTLAISDHDGGALSSAITGGMRVEGVGVVRLAVHTGPGWTDTTTVTGTLEIAERTSLVGTPTFVACDGCLRWTGGNVFGPTVTIPAGSFLDVVSATGSPTRDPWIGAGATLASRGTVRLRGPHRLVVSNATLTNEGTLELAGGGEGLGGVRLVNRGLLVKRGAGTAYLGPGALRNEGGTVRVEADTLVLGGRGGGWADVGLRGGSRIEGPGVVRVVTNTALDNRWAGTTTITTRVEIADDRGRAGNLNGDVAVVACDGCLRWTGGNLGAGSRLTVAAGSFLDVEGAAPKGYGGATLVNFGTVRWRAAAPPATNTTGFVFNHGRFEADGPGGPLHVHFTNEPDGVLAVGVGAGLDTARVAGDLVQNGVVEVEVGPDGTGDRLVVGGRATLGGGLVVRPVGAYAPAVSDARTVLVAASVRGAFARVHTVGTDAARFDAAYTATTASVVARTGGPAAPFVVFPDTLVGGAYRTVTLFGAGLDGLRAARLECDGCQFPDSAASAAADVALGPAADGRRLVTFDLLGTGIEGGYRLVLTDAGGREARAPVYVLPHLAVAAVHPLGSRGIGIGPGSGLRYSPLHLLGASNSADRSFFLVRFTPIQAPAVRMRVVDGADGEVVADWPEGSDRRPVTFLASARSWGVADLRIGAGVDPSCVLFPPAVAARAPSRASPRADDAAPARATTGHRLTCDRPSVRWNGEQTYTVESFGSLAPDRFAALLVAAFRDTTAAALRAYAERIPDYPAVVAALVAEAVANEAANGATPYRTFLGRIVAALDARVAGKTGRDGDPGEIVWNNLTRSWEPRAHRDWYYRRRAEQDARLERTGRIQRGGRPVQAVSGRLITSAIAANPPQPKPYRDDDTPEYHHYGTLLGKIPRAGFDPNDKTSPNPHGCELGDALVDGVPVARCVRHYVPLARAADTLTYTVEFENKAFATGPAGTVVVTDTLDAALAPATFHVVGASRDSLLTTTVSGRVVTFRFTGIDLPPNRTPPEGQGFVRYRVRPRAALAPGTEIANRASVVFDFNPPILTPTVRHVVTATADPALSVALEDSARVGRPFTLALRVRNGGPDPADSVRVAPVVRGAGVVAVTTDAGACVAAGGGHRCALGRLGPGAEATVRLTVRADVAGRVEFADTVRAATADADPFNSVAGFAVDLATGTAAEPGGALPTAFALHAPAPNPTHGALALAYDVPRAGPVRLAVFDALGREVARVVSADVTPGRHRATLDAARLAAGVYFVRLTAAGFAAVRSVAVVR